MKSAWLAVALVGITLQARALGGLADVEVLDRETGSVLPTYRHNGEYWVAGRPGGRYSIVIRNRRGERVLAVTAVDGVNVISGETGEWGQSGYVFEPGQHYEIPGWRKSQREVADFNFTSSADSYAARTGRPANVGVIGVALFLEKPPRSDYSMNFSRRIEIDAAQARSSDLPAPPAAAPSPAPATAPDKKAQASSARAASVLPAPKLGTGHGSLETNVVLEVAFNRLSSTPNEIIRIRYDSVDNLVAMGVVDRQPSHGRFPIRFPIRAIRNMFRILPAADVDCAANAMSPVPDRLDCIARFALHGRAPPTEFLLGMHLSPPRAGIAHGRRKNYEMRCLDRTGTESSKSRAPCQATRALACVSTASANGKCRCL